MTIKRNLGCTLDLCWLNTVNINDSSINELAKKIVSSIELNGVQKAEWTLKAVTLIDLTTLSGDDTNSTVTKLCNKAAKPIDENILKKLDFDYCKNSIYTAAVCVYPSRVEDAVNALKNVGMYDKINVASVAAGFPAGQTPLEARLIEIKYAVEKGAKEIDIVIDRSLVLTGKWEQLYQEIKLMKEACGPVAHLKTILATGELVTYNNVYKVSLIAMMAGSDFIKTSTGKETVNATLPVGLVMARAIKEYQQKMGYKVGLKPAGGIRTTKDAIEWLVLVKEELGDEWLTPELFRFGASGLLGDLEGSLQQYVNCKTSN